METRLRPLATNRRVGRPGLGIAEAARTLGVERTKLWKVVRGLTHDPELLERFQEIAPGRLPPPEVHANLVETRTVKVPTGEKALHSLLRMASKELSASIRRREIYRKLLHAISGLTELRAGIDRHIPGVAPHFSADQVRQVVESFAGSQEIDLRVAMMNSNEALRLINPTAAAAVDKELYHSDSPTTAALLLRYMANAFVNVCDELGDSATKPKNHVPKSK